MSQLSHVEIGKIKPAEYNPRDITDEAFAGLRSSIRQFGLVDPLIRNTRTGNLVGGHQRLKAAIAEGLQKVPVIDIDVSLDEEKAINIVLNNPHIGGFYTESLRDLLGEVMINLPDLNLVDLKLGETDLGSLIFSSEWESDLASIENVEENLDGIISTIKITCPQEDKDNIIVLLKNHLTENGYDNADVS